MNNNNIINNNNINNNFEERRRQEYMNYLIKIFEKIISENKKK